MEVMWKESKKGRDEKGEREGDLQTPAALIKGNTSTLRHGTDGVCVDLHIHVFLSSHQCLTMIMSVHTVFRYCIL